MPTTAKITPADYPDLLAAVDARVPQRELARRYDCSPSLIARHVSRAKHARELDELTQERDPVLSRERHSGSMREILEARIRDPKTSARDLASLTNALARLHEEEEPPSRHPSIYGLRRGTLILEPAAGAEHCYRLMLRVRGGIEHVAGGAYELDADDALYLLMCALGSASSLTPEDLPGHPLRAKGAELLVRYREQFDSTDAEETLPEGVYEVYPRVPE